jgi:exopolysaccharide biosynthesis WecB/TagA/CpsF family protein
MTASYNNVQILGVNFFNDTLEHALNIAHESGGLILAPSGPGLAELGKNPLYDTALKEADINLIDSGYLALLWQKNTGHKIKRHSGLKYIKSLIEDPRFKENKKQLWIMPTEKNASVTQNYLISQQIVLMENNFYVAPFYQPTAIEDADLLEQIKTERPEYIIFAIAGGKQEILGHWIRKHLDYKPAIICIGAAIAFLSGQQAKIPSWADRFYIGWFLRIIADPKTFIPRYWKAQKLRSLLSRYGENSPPSSLSHSTASN